MKTTTHVFIYLIILSAQNDQNLRMQHILSTFEISPLLLIFSRRSYVVSESVINSLHVVIKQTKLKELLVR